VRATPSMEVRVILSPAPRVFSVCAAKSWGARARCAAREHLGGAEGRGEASGEGGRRGDEGNNDGAAEHVELRKLRIISTQSAIALQRIFNHRTTPSTTLPSRPTASRLRVPGQHSTHLQHALALQATTHADARQDTAPSRYERTPKKGSKRRPHARNESWSTLQSPSLL
jgi:hypothetical protein